MIKAIRREIPAGRDPMGLAASVLYLSSLSNDEKITQADLANAAGVTEVTLRKGAKDLRKELSKSIRN
jgi:transcription initiation factor TFIIB